jgi:dUTP pyrophosphatase
LLKVKLLHLDAKVPTVVNIGEDHGYDLHSIEDVVIRPGEMGFVKTGIAIEFDPPAGARIAERSSLGKRGIGVRGGEIDSGYRGEIVVMLQNHNPRESECLGNPKVLCIQKGDKIAQLVKETNIITSAPVQVDELSASNRAELGFGSSGR